MVRVFKGLEDNHTYYAVTGTSNVLEAAREVARHKKMSYQKFMDIFKTPKIAWGQGTIAHYKKNLDGLWFIRHMENGEPCIIITTMNKAWTQEV